MKRRKHKGYVLLITIVATSVLLIVLLFAFNLSYSSNTGEIKKRTEDLRETVILELPEDSSE